MEMKRLRRKRNNDKERKLKEKEAAPTLCYDIFWIPIVTDLIWGFLPTSDIIISSLVCKKWKELATNCLEKNEKKKRNSILSIDLTNDKKRGVKKEINQRLQLLLKGILEFPNLLKGLKLKFDHTGECPQGVNKLNCDQESEAYKKLIETRLVSRIIANLPIMKYLIIRFNTSDQLCNFDYEKIVRSIFWKLSPNQKVNLENLKITGTGRNFLSNIFDTATPFSNLKSIQASYVGDYLTRPELASKHYKNILCSCPFLAELNMIVEYTACAIFDTKSKLHLIKRLLIFKGGLNLTFGDENYKAREKMRDGLNDLFVGKYFNPYSEQDFTFFARILQLNSNSLRRFTMQLNCLEEVSRLHFPTLLNMKEVIIQSDCSEDAIRNNPHLQSFFPNAKIIAQEIGHLINFDPVSAQ